MAACCWPSSSRVPEARASHGEAEDTQSCVQTKKRKAKEKKREELSAVSECLS